MHLVGFIIRIWRWFPLLKRLFEWPFLVCLCSHTSVAVWLKVRGLHINLRQLMCISRSLKSRRRLPYDDDDDDSHQHSLSLSQRPGTLVWTVVSIVLEIVDCVFKEMVNSACLCMQHLPLYTWLPKFVKRNYDGAYGIVSVILLYPISRIHFSVAPVLKLFHSDHAIDDSKFYCESWGHHDSCKLSTCKSGGYRYFESVVIFKQPKKILPKIKAAKEDFTKN